MSNSTTDNFVSAREAFLFDPKLSPEARIAGLYLARRYELTPAWHPRYQDIAERCGITPYAAQKALRELKAAGYLAGGKKTRVEGRWRNSPLRANFRLRDTALYWRDKSPGFGFRNPESRLPESEGIYPQKETDKPKGLEDLGSRPGGRSLPVVEGEGAARTGEGASAPERRDACPYCGEPKLDNVRRHVFDVHNAEYYAYLKNLRAQGVA